MFEQEQDVKGKFLYTIINNIMSFGNDRFVQMLFWKINIFFLQTVYCYPTRYQEKNHTKIKIHSPKQG